MVTAVPPERTRWMNDCAICGLPFTEGRLKTTCGDPRCQRQLRRSKGRNRDHRKRAAESDITAGQDAEMRARARTCPLCGVRMTSTPNQPHSKELDHILPINQGGTHTLGNVRIICRHCNQTRPKDGSDFTGQLTLWAQGPVPVGRRRTMCGSGLHPRTAENIYTAGGRNYCLPCKKAAKRTNRKCQCGALIASGGRTFMCPACIAAAAARAAELHARGVTWDAVAAAVGYGTAEGARYAAKRIGYVPRMGQLRTVAA